MNLGNKLAVGEAVDPGIDSAVDLESDPNLSAPAVPNPAPAAVTVMAPEEPVAAHAER
ncbi:MAG TPA: hypothetical protein VIQ30_03690 [Pseudonocardia sp.]